MPSNTTVKFAVPIYTSKQFFLFLIFNNQKRKSNELNNMNRIILILSILIFSIATSSIAQTVNIESKRMQSDSIRFIFRGDFGGKFNDNNGKYILQIKSSIATQVKSRDLNTICFLVANQDLIRSMDNDFNNSWFLHLRANHEITNLFRLEAFVQNQNNKLLDMKNRFLVGAGVRLKLVSTDFMRLYCGNSYMYEIEQSISDEKVFYNHRNSTYLSFSVSLFKHTVEAISTTYFQPLYTDITNYNLLEQLKLDFSISKTISLFSLFDYSYSYFTPTQKRQYYTLVNLGVGLKF